MTKYAKGKYAVGMCGRCGGKYPLNRLVPDGQVPNLLVHPYCRDIKHEQEKRQIKEDAVILKRPSPDIDDMSPGDHPDANLTETIDGLKYLACPGGQGNYASSNIVLTINNDLDIRVRAALFDWSPVSDVLSSKFLIPGDQRSFQFFAFIGGVLAFQFSGNGVAITSKLSTIATGIEDKTTKYVRIVLDLDNGAGGNDAIFSLSDDGISYGQLGGVVTNAGVASIFGGSAPVVVGAQGDGTAAAKGKIFSSEIRIGGIVVSHFDAEDAEVGARSFISSVTGELWTINGQAQILGANPHFGGGT